MISGLKRSGEIDQLTRFLNFYSSICIENAQNHTIRPQLFGHDDVTPHRAELVGGVAEIACTRANHYM